MLSEPHQRVPWDEGIRPGHKTWPNFARKIAKTPTRDRWGINLTVMDTFFFYISI